MRRPSVLITIAFLAGLGIGYFVRSAGMGMSRRRDTRTADLAAIQRLDRTDVDATMTQDPSSLTNLFSDNAINLVFPAPAVGIKAIQEGFEKFRAEHLDFKVLKYAPDVKDVQIADGWALEVLNIEATYKVSEKDNPVTVQDKAMRVLKRQSDGSWKFALVGLK
jgi:uncharacterized protein (TIGR02246 family)